MKRRFRADGIAVASLVLVATTAIAGPTGATHASAVSVTALAHGSTDHSWSVASHAAAANTKGAGQGSIETVEARRPDREPVHAHAGRSLSNPERECLAGAVYFEARGEPIEGQLAVAEVVLNRAASGEYPRSICDVVTQPAQFSFVRDGGFPPIDRASDGWRKAVAVARRAAGNRSHSLSSDVLWYHADYVAPGWARHLDRVTQIGAHIFYRRG